MRAVACCAAQLSALSWIANVTGATPVRGDIGAAD